MSTKVPTYKEIRDFIIKKMGFCKKRETKSSHIIYEGFYNGKRRVVTLDRNHDKLSANIQKKNFSSMVKQMGFKNKNDPEFKKLFYGKSRKKK